MKTLRKMAMGMLLAVLSLSCSTNDGDIVQRETIYATSSAMQDDEIYVDSTMEGELLPNGVTLKKVDSLYLYQGDILLTYDQAMSLTPIGGSELRASISTDAIKYWRNRTVYYTYSPGFNLRDNVERAIREWESKTALKFLKGTGKGDYISFTQGSGLGASSLGMVGGEQKIFLGRGSTYGTAIHEIGHAMGLIHEQCRNDRDKYITILWQNISNDPDTKSQFKLRPAGEVQDIGPFDFSSVMLYSSYAGANEYGKPAMVTKDGRTFAGQRTHLSTWDVEGIQSVYGPPFQNLSHTTEVIVDEVNGLEDHYESEETYRIDFYEDQKCTIPAKLKYPRTIAYYVTHKSGGEGGVNRNVELKSVVVPAGTSSFYLGTATTKEHYVMSNLIYIDVTYFSLMD